MSLPPPTSKIGSPPVMLVESGEGSPTVVLVPSSPGTAVVDEVLPTLVVPRSGVLVLASGLAGHWLEHALLRDLSNCVQGLAQSGFGMGWFTAQAELAHDGVISIAASAATTVSPAPDTSRTLTG